MSNLALPDHLDAERFILGALMTFGVEDFALKATLAALCDEDFSLEKHKRILLRAKELDDRGIHVDHVTLANELIKCGQLESVDGLSYLISLNDGLPRLYNLDNYIAILKEKALLRRIIGFGQELIQRCISGGEDPQSIVASIGATSESLVLSTEAKEDLRSPREIIETVGANEILTPKRESGIETPIRYLTEKGLTLTKKTLTILAARPSVGKSAFALCIAAHAARQKKRVAIYSHEDDAEAIIRRMISQQGAVNMQRVRIGIAEADERHKAWNAMNYLADLEDMLLISDSAQGTIPAIIRQLQKNRVKGRPIDLLIVDYLQLMTGVGRFDNRVQEIGSLSRGLKLISHQFDIPVLALSQLNRDSERDNREPRLRDLRDSGSIEQDANNVIFLHPRDLSTDGDERDIRLIIAKHKNGPTGSRDLKFVKRYLTFREIETLQEVA